MTQDDVRKAAYAKWEEEGKPDGQGMRHWLEAEQDLKARAEAFSEAGAGVRDRGHDSEQTPTSSDAVPFLVAEPEKFKPGELASENK